MDTVYVILRNEDERRCFVGVARSKKLAKTIVQDNIKNYEGIYYEDDYDIIQTAVIEPNEYIHILR